MRIPKTHGDHAKHAHVAGEARAHVSAEPFRLSPPEPPPEAHHKVAAAHHHPATPLHRVEHDTEFELIVDKAELAGAIDASPDELRKNREIDEFKRTEVDIRSWVTTADGSFVRPWRRSGPRTGSTCSGGRGHGHTQDSPLHRQLGLYHLGAVPRDDACSPS